MLLQFDKCRIFHIGVILLTFGVINKYWCCDALLSKRAILSPVTVCVVE